MSIETGPLEAKLVENTKKYTDADEKWKEAKKALATATAAANDTLKKAKTAAEEAKKTSLAEPKELVSTTKTARDTAMKEKANAKKQLDSAKKNNKKEADAKAKAAKAAAKPAKKKMHDSDEESTLDAEHGISPLAEYLHTYHAKHYSANIL